MVRLNEIQRQTVSTAKKKKKKTESFFIQNLSHFVPPLNGPLFIRLFTSNWIGDDSNSNNNDDFIVVF